MDPDAKSVLPSRHAPPSVLEVQVVSVESSNSSVSTLVNTLPEKNKPDGGEGETNPTNRGGETNEAETIGLVGSGGTSGG